MLSFIFLAMTPTSFIHRVMVHDFQNKRVSPSSQMGFFWRAAGGDKWVIDVGIMSCGLVLFVTLSAAVSKLSALSFSLPWMLFWSALLHNIFYSIRIYLKLLVGPSIHMIDACVSFYISLASSFCCYFCAYCKALAVPRFLLPNILEQGGSYIHARGLSVYHVFRCITVNSLVANFVFLIVHVVKPAPLF